MPLLELAAPETISAGSRTVPWSSTLRNATASGSTRSGAPA
jgi:hypothetical protein